MNNFLIEQKEPYRHENDILSFWKDYLPDTPVKRLSWMTKNPDGPPVWYFAYLKDTNKLVGMISVMPRNMWVKGNILKAGIMGDFMIIPEYRAFGPALELLQNVTKSVMNKRFDLIITIPNQASFAICKKAGFTTTKSIHYYIKPLEFSRYLSVYINPNFSRLISPIVLLLSKILWKDTYIREKGHFDCEPAINKEFEKFWGKVKIDIPELLMDRKNKTLQWHYLDNPLHKYKIITYSETEKSELLGYIIYTIEEKKLEIYDLFSINVKIEGQLIKKITHVAQINEVEAIYIRLSSDSKIGKRIKNYGFLMSKNFSSVMSYGNNKEKLSTWSYVEGDRNI